MDEVKTAEAVELEEALAALRENLAEETAKYRLARLRALGLELGASETAFKYLEKLVDFENDPEFGKGLEEQIRKILEEIPSLRAASENYAVNPAGTEGMDSQLASAGLRGARDRKDILSVVAMKLGRARQRRE